MTKIFSMKLVVLTAMCLFLIAGQALAQASGSITGVVADSTGAIVPNATVKLVNANIGVDKTITANDDGIYTFSLLQPGKYTVTANSGSFAAQSFEVEVQVGRTTAANFTLGVSGVSAVVEVTAEGVQTTQSNSDAVLNQTAINNLPINGRRFQDFVTLTPTAQVDPQRGQISLSGQRGINSNINVDGVDYNQPFFGGIRGGERSNLAFTIPQESIKEFQVVAAGYTAEFGRSTGGIVNAITKSGDNSLRGSLFWLYRPQQLARGNEFSKALQEQRLSALGTSATLAPTQHQFGGSVGGPIKKEKLFYFASYEQQRFRAPRQILFNFPTGYTTVDAARRPVFDFYNGLQTSYGLTNDAYALLGRVDWNVNDSNRINVRYNRSNNSANNAVSRGETSLDPTTSQALSTNGTEKNRNNIVVAQFNTTFSAKVINEGRFQFAREDRPRISNSALPQVQASFGTLGATAFLPTTQYDTRYQVTDALTYISGNHVFKFGGEYSRIFASQVFGFNQFGQYTQNIGSTATNTDDILTRLANVPTSISATQTVLGRFDDTRARYNRQIGNLQASFKIQELAFFGQDNWRINSKLSVNYGLRVEQQFNPTPEANNTQVLDTVRNTVFPIRGRGFDGTQIPDSGWEYGPRVGFAYDPKGDGKTVIRGYSGLYYARTPGLVFAGSVNNYRTPPGDVSTTLPFTGFTQATFETFLGTAAGAPYVSITGCNLAAATGTDGRNRCIPNSVYRQFAILGINLNASALNSLPILTVANISSVSSALGLSPNSFTNAGVTGHAEDFKNPVSFQYGFGVEREVAKNFVVGVDFGHVKTTRLQRNRDLNLPAPLTGEQYRALIQTANTAANYTALVNNGLIDSFLRSGRQYIAIVAPATTACSATVTTNCLSSGAVLPTRQRPTQAAGLVALGPVQIRESTAKSLFNELTVRARLVRGWGQLNAYYTFSRNYSDDDNERDAGGVAYANPYNVSGEYGFARIDRRDQFVANPVFFLPYGFEVSSSIRLRSGNPVNAFASGDLNGDSIANDRPLSEPGIQFRRNTFRNRGTVDVDLRIQKGFKLGEQKRLIFSTEFFNVLNRANIIFPNPGTNSTGGLTSQYCVSANQVCGLNGSFNPNFLTTIDQVTTSATFGKILVNNVNPGSGVFQMQLGARFQF